MAQPLCKARIMQYPIITERSKVPKKLVCPSIRPTFYTRKPRVNFLIDEGNQKWSFEGGLGVFQSNHLHSTEKISTTMIYPGLYVSRMSVEAIVR